LLKGKVRRREGYQRKDRFRGCRRRLGMRLARRGTIRIMNLFLLPKEISRTRKRRRRRRRKRTRREPRRRRRMERRRRRKKERRRKEIQRKLSTKLILELIQGITTKLSQKT